MTTPQTELSPAQKAARRAEVQKAMQEAAARHQAARDGVPDPFAGTHLARPAATPTKEQPK